MERRGYDWQACFAVRVAVEEALTNAMQHGNRDDPDKTVTLEYAVEPDSVLIEIEDQGLGFDPGAVPDPTRDENVDIPSGRGIMLIRAYMTEVSFSTEGNRIRMRYAKRG